MVGHPWMRPLNRLRPTVIRQLTPLSTQTALGRSTRVLEPEAKKDRAAQVGQPGQTDRPHRSGRAGMVAPTVFPTQEGLLE